MAETSLVLHVSGRCNLRCAFCFERDGRLAREPTLAEVRALLLRHDPTRIRNVMFMSAETLLRGDTQRLIELTRELGFANIGLATNATLLHRAERLERLLEAGLNGLELSIHTLDPDHARALSGRDFTPERQLAALGVVARLQKNHPLTCTINTVVCELNAGDVGGLIHTVERQFPELQPTFHIKYPTALARIAPRVALATWPLIRSSGLAAALPEPLHRRVNFEDFPLCALAPHFHLSANLGSFLGHERYHYAGPGEEAAEADALLSRSRAFDRVCRSCTVNMLCPGVDPFYLDHFDAAGHFQPMDRDPVDLLHRCARFRQTRGWPVRPYALRHPEDLVEYLAFGLQRVL